MHTYHITFSKYSDTGPQEDHEIFDLVSALEAAEGVFSTSLVCVHVRHVASLVGKGTTFYSWLDVPHTASTSEISKAYRKNSLQLQYVPVLLFVP